MRVSRLACSALTMLLAAGTGSLPALGQIPPAPVVTAQNDPAMVIESSRTVVDFQTDGTGTREVTAAVKILKDSALKSLSVLAFGYATDSEAVEIAYVRVRMADGSLVVTPAENVQDVAPASAGAFPVYTDAREKHIAVKSLAVGDTLEFHVHWRLFKPAIPGQFATALDMPTTEIVKEKIDQVSFPADRTYKVASHGLEPEQTVEGGRRTLRWVQSNLAPPIPAARAPWAGHPAPRIMVTSLQSWQEVGAWYRGLEAPQEEVTAAIKAKAKALTSGLTGDRDRIEALYTFVSTQIHYLGLSFGTGRYRPHAAGEVLANGYGDCKDKHTLLASLLKASGLEAWPAMMRATGDLDREIPSHTQFDHLVTVVPLEGGWLWLDTTPEVAPFGYLGSNLRGRPALVIPPHGPAELREAPAELPFPQESTFTFNGRLEEGGRLQGHCTLALRGDAEITYRQIFQRIPQEQWAHFIAQTSAPMGLGFEFTAIAPSPSSKSATPFSLDWAVTGHDTDDWKAQRLIVPLMPAGLEHALNSAPRPTDSIFLVSPGFTFLARATVELPPAVNPSLPPPVVLSSPAGTYRAEYSFAKGILSVERKLTLREGEILPKDRKDFSDFVQAMNNDECRYLDLGGHGPDLAKEDPTTIALFNQGVEAQNRQDWSSARDAYQKVLERSPTFPGAHLNHAITYLVKGDPQSATRDLLKEEELHPELALTYVVLGKVHAFQGQKADAIAQWKTALAKDPDNREPATLLVDLLHNDRRYLEAVAVLEQLLLRDPGNVEDLLNLAEDYGRTAQNAKVEALLTKAVNLGGTTEVLVKAARVQADSGLALTLARAWAEKAASLLDKEALSIQDPEPGLANTARTREVWATLGGINLEEGHLQDALRFLKAAWSLGYHAPEGMALARAYERLGRNKEAANLYALAAVCYHADSVAIAQKYRNLTGRPLDNGTSHAVVRGKMMASPRDHLIELRTSTFSCPRGNGTVHAVLMATSAGVEAVHLLEDAEKFPVQANAAKAMRLHLEFPDQAPHRVFISGGMQFSGTKGTFITLDD